ncbi:hypothetical protein ACFLQ0_06020, partial [Nitrospinota bacterium]
MPDLRARPSRAARTEPARGPDGIHRLDPLRGGAERDHLHLRRHPPPKEDGETDLSQVESAAKEIAGALNGHKIIVNKSTVPVGTGD